VSIANHSPRFRWALLKISKVNPLGALFKSKKKVAHHGPLSQLKAIEDTLLCYIFELRKQGIINVNTFVITLRALYLLPEF